MYMYIHVNRCVHVYVHEIQNVLQVHTYMYMYTHILEFLIRFDAWAKLAQQ